MPLGKSSPVPHQLYNFGETVSVVFWTESWRPESFYDKILQNRAAGLHTLCLLGKLAEAPPSAVRDAHLRMERLAAEPGPNLLLFFFSSRPESERTVFGEPDEVRQGGQRPHRSDPCVTGAVVSEARRSTKLHAS